MKNSKLVRIHNEAFENFMDAKRKMEQDLSKQVKFNVDIPLSNVITEASKQLIYPDDISKLLKKRWKNV